MKTSIKISSAFTAEHWHDKTLNEGTHPHNFRYTITLCGPLNSEGYIVDFREVSAKLSSINIMLDSKVLNDIISTPTAENVVAFIFKEIQKSYPSILTKVELRETDDYAATFQI